MKKIPKRIPRLDTILERESKKVFKLRHTEFYSRAGINKLEKQLKENHDIFMCSGIIELKKQGAEFVVVPDSGAYEGDGTLEISLGAFRAKMNLPADRPDFVSRIMKIIDGIFD